VDTKSNRNEIVSYVGLWTTLILSLVILVQQLASYGLV
jgi:hypothetical protein